MGDPFFEMQENHHLIGVASLFLEAILHDVCLAYQVPIISQQGEVAGRLHVSGCSRCESRMPRVDGVGVGGDRPVPLQYVLCLLPSAGKFGGSGSGHRMNVISSLTSQFVVVTV